MGSGAPKGALSNHVRVADECAKLIWRGLRVAFQQRARLSALTLAALATGSTRWLSSRTGFPAAFAQQVFCPFRLTKAAAVKHAPCRPVFVPVDRGPEAARERIGKETKIRARGPHLAPLLRHAVRNGALSERDGGGYRHRFRQVKGVGNSADESARFTPRAFQKARGTRMILCCRASSPHTTP
jgi:hypothetical protein